ncbi:MAG: orotidine-5'-phosphate decarboxylase [Gemmatimonadales bacterium]|nr:MAG: orotidine-5'-phosphate decarboxylase [Gemmatimonadales bacterium]
MAHVIVALDVPDAPRALELAHRLGGDEPAFVKVGLELFVREGPDIVRALREQGHPVFLDLKLHDIPATVAGAVRSAASLGVRLLTVHASGGRPMLEAAATACREASGQSGAGRGPHEGGLQLLGVTVLTALGPAQVDEAWGRGTGQTRPEADVLRLAGLALDSGLHGVVASPLEAPALRARFGPGPLLVTPGIREAGGDRHDQVRVATPEEAVRGGASHLVVGRAVTATADPARALAGIRARTAREATREVAGEPHDPMPAPGGSR